VLFGIVILAWRICGFRLMATMRPNSPVGRRSRRMLFIAGVQFLISAAWVNTSAGFTLK